MATGTSMAAVFVLMCFVETLVLGVLLVKVSGYKREVNRLAQAQKDVLSMVQVIGGAEGE